MVAGVYYVSSTGGNAGKLRVQRSASVVTVIG